jgi:outer membrane lipoprotein-sorting protein
MDSNTNDWPHGPGVILKKLALVLLLLTSLGASACVKTIKSTPTAIKAYDRLTARALVEKVNALQNVSSLTASTSIRLTDLKLSTKGKIEPYRPADGKILLQRPQLIRMLIRIPIIKQNIADMTSDGERFRIAVYYPDEYKRFLTGSNTSNYEDELEDWKDHGEDKEKLSSIIKIRPQHITEALLVRPIDPDDSNVNYFVADMRQEEPKSELSKERVIRTYQVLYVLERVQGGELKLQREFWFDRTQPSMPLTRMQLFNGNGALISEVYYKQYQKLDDGIVWPKVVEVSRAQDNYSLEITFDDIRTNDSIDKRAFVLENSSRLPERDLDAPQQPPRASPEH